MLKVAKYSLAAFIVSGIAAGSAVARDAGYANAHLLRSADELVTTMQYEVTAVSMGATDTLRIIDVRPELAYKKGHIPGAVNIPFTDLTDQFGAVKGSLKSNAAIADLLGRKGIGQTSKVVVYDDHGGFRAARLFWLLEYFGHRNVSILNGGLSAWTGAGHKLATPKRLTMADIAQGKGAPQATVFSPTLTPRRHASADYILERKGDDQTVVIDVRGASAFAKGHIPWASNIAWKQNLSADKLMRPAGELKAHFARHGVTPDKNVVIHCQTGEAAAHSYFTLRLIGYPRVRTYHRSWAEWGAADDLPKAKASEG